MSNERRVPALPGGVALERSQCDLVVRERAPAHS
jgi:hypothetical protein